VQGFVERTGIDAELRLMGDLTEMSDSQRIALTRIVQECLSNIREHSGASNVDIRISNSGTHIAALISDDGRGFDVHATLVQAARRGRLGLVGMHERVRLLGGTCRVDSSPSSSTVVRVTLPRWQGFAARPEPGDADAA
jgi:signal transduction histidine kinase